MDSSSVFLGVHLGEVADAIESCVEGVFIASYDLIDRIAGNVNFSYHVVDVHGESSCPCSMDTGVHVVSLDIESTHERVGGMVEEKGYVVMHSPIAASFSAPHIAHARVMNAIVYKSPSRLGILNLCIQRRNEPRNNFVIA
ncbi:hypothetical protein SDC9_66068 [bioreactor metagenome]|uniref:Uncharacterized protein n=1 Tax=bioreactor metagenome TaxID=1076179 RepID=A0A644XTV7_9ZZZZ